jgi:lipopolysaccharide export system protein LptA
MEKKYELIETDCKDLYRIKALKDFELVTGEVIKTGDLGGFVSGKYNLSQEGNCWIGYNAGACQKAKVMDNAVLKDCSRTLDNSTISGNAVLKDYSRAFDNSTVSGNAVLKDYSRAFDNSTISGNAVMQDYSTIRNFSTISGNAVINDDSKVYDNSTVSGNAVMKDFSWAKGDSIITGNALLQEDQHIQFGTVTTDLLGTKDLIGTLYAELGVVPNDNKVVLYKKVWSTDEPDVFESNYDRSFLYKIGETVVAEDVNEDVFKSCAGGLHFTSLEFVNRHKGNTILECEVKVPDIVTVQASQVRARKCRVIGIYKEE